jgi:hypothetical protein
MSATPRTLLDRLRAEAERQLTPEERAAREAIPVTDAEREEVLSLVRWFCTRYPTPLERLAYVRRARRRWAAASVRDAE